MFLVIHPTAGLNDRLIYTPVSKFFLKKGPTNISRTMQLSGSVVIKNVGKQSGMSIKKVFLSVRIIFRGHCVLFCNPVESRIWYGMQCTNECLMSCAPNINDDPLSFVCRWKGLERSIRQAFVTSEAIKCIGYWKEIPSLMKVATKQYQTKKHSWSQLG